MNNQDFIPESLASQLAGVSAVTLSRFVEAGYLRVHNDNQGSRNYSKDEICKLFAIDPSNPMSDAYLASSVEVINEDNLYGEDNLGENFSVQETIRSNEENEKIYWADTVSPAEEPAFVPETQVAPVPEFQPVAPAPAQELKQSEDYAKDKAEIIRLRNLTVMQDKILEMRETQIDELRKEKEWLRTRVEKLEEKAERDQLLLLAETQTIKQLVNMSHQKKPSTIRLALEWFGLAPQNQSKEIQINGKTGKIIE